MANIFKPMKSQTPPPYTKVLSDSVWTGPEPSHIIYGNMPWTFYSERLAGPLVYTGQSVRHKTGGRE